MTVSSIIVAGCDSGPRLIPVTGSVTVDGTPAEGATLIFHPADTESQSLATANVGADGKFSTISDLKPGINAGNYKVTIVWPDPSIKPTEAQKMTGMFGDAPDLLNGRFDTPAKTNLSANITDATTELPAFELTKQ